MILKDVQPPIAVEGHTDSVPLRECVFGDNWGLSARRAAAVVSYFGEKWESTRSAFRPWGSDSTGLWFEPIRTSIGRWNRRVDVVLLSQFSQ
jgi:chemotaxis protein MotB